MMQSTGGQHSTGSPMNGCTYWRTALSTPQQADLVQWSEQAQGNGLQPGEAERRERLLGLYDRTLGQRAQDERSQTQSPLLEVSPICQPYGAPLTCIARQDG